MKYTEDSSKKRGNSAFYIVLAVCLLVIGIAAWAAFSNMAETKTKPNTGNNSSQNNEYNNNNPSYNENTNPNTTPSEGIENATPTTPTAEEKQDVPVEEPKPQKAYSMPVNGEILKDFSLTALQYSETYGDMRIHGAVDISCKEGTVVTACTDGKVESVEQTATYGTVVKIDHGEGLVIKYSSLKNVNVKNGDTVKTGDNLGTVTEIPSECTEQSHIHLEAYKNSQPISILSLFE